MMRRRASLAFAAALAPRADAATIVIGPGDSIQAARAPLPAPWIGACGRGGHARPLGRPSGS